MSWAYVFFSNRQATVVIDEMLNQLNRLTAAEAATAKVGHSDVKDSDSRGAVIYNSGAQQPPPNNLTGPWRRQVWSTYTDYQAKLQEICDCLNGAGAQPLTEVEAAHAKFSMSDIKEGTCHMVLFWKGATS